MSAIRYTRQARLAEVGELGQERIARSTIDVRGAGARGAIEATYLAAAGVGRLRVRDESHARAARAIASDVVIVSVEETEPAAAAPSESPVALLALDPHANDVAIGAWCALDSLRRALFVLEARAVRS